MYPYGLNSFWEGGGGLMRLAEIRKSKGFTRIVLSEMVKASAQSIYRWEKGLRQPDATMVQRLAKALDVTADELLDSLTNPQEPAREA